MDHKDLLITDAITAAVKAERRYLITRWILIASVIFNVFLLIK